MPGERQTWNHKYSIGPHGPAAADPFLVRAFEDFIEPLFPQAGNALDLAGGLGRHAIWLAKRNWRVTLLDISDVGINKAQKLAGKYKDKIKFRIADASKFKATKARYELILVFFYLERKVFPELLCALKPGGLLIYKTYTRLHPSFGRGPTHRMHLLEENELLGVFRNLNVLHCHETIRDRGIAEFVGRKS